MNEIIQEVLMLGTGHATVTNCYNTCFMLRVGETRLLVDGGGGNGILRQFKRAGIDFGSLSAIFITHAHTDHIIGLLWVVRMLCVHIFSHPDFHMRIYGNKKSADVLSYMCQNMLADNYRKAMDGNIEIVEVRDGDTVNISENLSLKIFDLISTNEPQLGFSAILPDGKKLVCLGDEPFVPHLAQHVMNADWLLCEAYCLHEDEERFQAHYKHHGTVMEAAMIAEQYSVRNLLLYHTEDTDLEHRKSAYTTEAKDVFSGNVHVPDDLESVIL